MDEERREQLENTAIGFAIVPALLQGAAAILIVAMGIAVFLGRVGVWLGAAGMGGALALAVGSAVMKRQKLRRAMRESDLP